MRLRPTVLLSLGLLACGRKSSTSTTTPTTTTTTTTTTQATHAARPAMAPQHDGASDQLRLLTYNVYVYNRDLAATAALIRRIDADVVVLQETLPTIETALRGALADVYPFMEFHVGPIGNGPGVLAKQAWSSARYVPSTTGYNGWWIGTFDLAGRRFQLVDAHLHPSPIAGWNPFAAAAAYGEGERVRVAQVDELIAALTPGLPTLVLGDFNSLPGSPTLQHLAALGYADALAGTTAQGEATFRFAGFGVHIDHVVVTSELTCASSAVLAEGTSDHFPLTTTLRWSPPS